jgi:hypothetical protein
MAKEDFGLFWKVDHSFLGFLNKTNITCIIPGNIKPVK